MEVRTLRDQSTRTVAGLVGDELAAHPAGKRFGLDKLSTILKRTSSAIGRAVNELAGAGAVIVEPDPKDARKKLVYMPDDKRTAWRADSGASVAAAGVSLIVPSFSERAAKASAGRTEKLRPPLRFGMWADGALVIEGLAKRQLTLPAGDTATLAALFSSFPEGSLAALCASPLQPAFTLRIDGHAYPMTGEQTAALIAYIEQLPAKAMRGSPGSADGTYTPRTQWFPNGGGTQS